MRRKEERSEQGQTNNKAKQHTCTCSIPYAVEQSILQETRLGGSGRHNPVLLTFTCTCTVPETCPVQWVIVVFIPLHLGMCAYSCSQLRELWFSDFVYTCTCLYIHIILYAVLHDEA